MSIGHKCSGGGAQINNSPVNITLHVHIHSDVEPTIQKIKRAFYGIIGQRNTVIEGASQLHADELQGCISRQLSSQ